MVVVLERVITMVVLVRVITMVVLSVRTTQMLHHDNNYWVMM